MTENEQALNLPQDERFQRAEWSAQRCGWAASVLLIAVALAGAFGDGPLSSAGVSNGNLHVQFERFGRRRTFQSMHLYIAPNSGGTVRRTVWFSRNLVDAMEIQSMVPEPEGQLAAEDRVEFTFSLAPAERAHIAIEMRPRRAGSVTGMIGVDKGPGVGISQFIWP